MIIDIKQNDYNLRSNIKNIKEFNYISFNKTEWEKVGTKLGRHLPSKENYPYKVEIEATKVNPIVKIYFATKEYNNECICIKLTPYEVMVSENAESGFKYNRRITHEWQDILAQTFGESYENAKNKHYGIKTI